MIFKQGDSVFLNIYLYLCCSVKTKAGQAKNKSRFESYFDFRCSINSIKPHQVLALNRGEKKKELKLGVEIPDAVFERDLECTCLRLVRRPPGDSQIKNLISEAMKEAYKRLVKPMIKRKVRALLTRNAEKEALNVFANNLRELLLTPPCRNSVIMAIGNVQLYYKSLSTYPKKKS